MDFIAIFRAAGRLTGPTVREASEAAILDADEAVYVLRVPGPSKMTISVNIGARAPAHATSLGRVLLAHSLSDELASFLAQVESVLDRPPMGALALSCTNANRAGR